jgi:hypothetical protein
LVKGAAGGKSSSNDGPYKLIHALFTSKLGTSAALEIDRSRHIDPEKKIPDPSKGTSLPDRATTMFKSALPTALGSNVIGFNYDAAIIQFYHMMSLNNAETMLYHCISWYNATYHGIKHDKLTFTGGTDAKREVEDGFEDWGATPHTRTLEDKFPELFFHHFATFFETFRVENMELYAKLQEIIRTHGVVEDDDKPEKDEFDQPIGDTDDDRP